MPLPIVTITGNLTADPEIRFTQSGTAVAKLRVACQDRKRDADGQWVDGDATYLDVTAWRQTAENVSESLSKGDRVHITGRLRQRTYEAKDGSQRTVYEVEADEIGASVARASVTVRRTERKQTKPSTEAVDDPWAAPF